MAKRLETMDIKGKDYVAVNTRLKHFRGSSDYKDWRILYKLIDDMPSRIVVECGIFDEQGVERANSLAEEFREDNKRVNQYSALENAQTGALGRALGMLGIGIDSEIATTEEVQRNTEQMYAYCVDALKIGKDKQKSIQYVDSILKSDNSFSTEQTSKLRELVQAEKVSLTMSKKPSNAKK